MARTPLLSSIEQIAARRSTPRAGGSTRRDFLRGAGAASALVRRRAAAGASDAAAQRRRARAPRIVVVGAGLAGLTAAYRLKQAGLQRAGPRGIRPRSAGAAGRSAAPSPTGRSPSTAAS